MGAEEYVRLRSSGPVRGEPRFGAGGEAPLRTDRSVRCSAAGFFEDFQQAQGVGPIAFPRGLAGFRIGVLGTGGFEQGFARGKPAKSGDQGLFGGEVEFFGRGVVLGISHGFTRRGRKKAPRNSVGPRDA